MVKWQCAPQTRRKQIDTHCGQCRAYLPGETSSVLSLCDRRQQSNPKSWTGQRKGEEGEDFDGTKFWRASKNPSSWFSQVCGRSLETAGVLCAAPLQFHSWPFRAVPFFWVTLPVSYKGTLIPKLHTHQLLYQALCCYYWAGPSNSKSPAWL